MKQNKKYFISYPNILLMLTFIIMIGVIVVSTLSVTTVVVGLLISALLTGIEPKVIGYKNKIELKYIGLFYFRNKTLHFENIEQVNIKYIPGKFSGYAFRFTLKEAKKEIVLSIENNENVIVLLHLLKDLNIKVFSGKEDLRVKHVYQLMEDERKVDSFNLDLRRYEKPSLFIEIWMSLIMLIFLIYLFKNRV